jgi:serine/threonine protein kinase
MFREGQQFGEYALVKKLGEGGFGEVWLAGAENKYFALKFPHKNQVDWKSITQEIGVWTLCGRHPNVVPLVGAKNFDGQIVIISEYVPDGSLEDLLKEKGRLSIGEAVAVTNGILQGLQHLHASGIVHGDLKPANILLDGKTPRLADFGISRASKHTNTMSRTIAGTLKYMAPESFDGKRNIQTDIWAVGVILYQMLTGTLPYEAEETVQFIAALVLKDPQPLPDFVPLALKNIIATALAKDVAERFRSAEQMRQNLLTISAQELNLKDVEIAAGNISQQKSQITLGKQIVQTAGIKQQTVESQKSKRFSPLIIVAGVFSILFLLLASLGGAGVYYYFGTKPEFVPPPKSPPYYSPTTPMTVNQEFNNTEGRIEEVLGQIEQKAGGKLKIVMVGIYSYSNQHYLLARIQDPNTPENYDDYTYRDGAIGKKPYKMSDLEKAVTYSVADVNWRAIPNLVKTAKEKIKDLDGMEEPYVFINPAFGSNKAVEITVLINGKRKDFRLTADADGNIKKTEIK